MESKLSLTASTGQSPAVRLPADSPRTVAGDLTPKTGAGETVTERKGCGAQAKRRATADDPSKAIRGPQGWRRHMRTGKMRMGGVVLTVAALTALAACSSSSSHAGSS